LASIAILPIRGGRVELMQKRTTAQALSGPMKRHASFFDLFAVFTRSNRVFDESFEHLLVVVWYCKIDALMFLQLHYNDCPFAVTDIKVALRSPLCLDALQSFIMVSLFMTHVCG
jgi:hypothetical protein